MSTWRSKPFSSKANMVAPGLGGDRETTQYMAIADQLSVARARADRSSEPPDQRLHRPVERPVGTPRPANSLSAETDIVTSKGGSGANNPKMVAQDNESRHPSQADWRRERENARASERAHRFVASLADRFARGRSRKSAEGVDRGSSAARPAHRIAARGSSFRADEVSARQRAAEQAEAEEQTDIFGHDGPRQGVPARQSSVSKTVYRDAGRDRRRPRARADALASGRERADRRVRFPIYLDYRALGPVRGRYR